MIDEENNTGVAEFSEGANIRIQVENGIISVMLITLPEKYRSLTRGLMGNFNGDVKDDFIPKGSTASISLESSAEEIFSFGKTCKSPQLNWQVNCVYIMSREHHCS